MTDKARYLITSADERTWKFDRPVIFLGEWCRRYDRRQVWSGMDAIVAAPYGLGQAQKDQDHALARNIEAQFLPLLRDVLNEFHGTNHGLRYWQIVLGHWLRRYVDVIFNRYHTLKQCVENYSISGTIVLKHDDYHLATLDSDSFVWACNDNIWNNGLCARILERMGGVNLKAERIMLKDGPGFRIWSAKNSESPAGAFRSMVRQQAISWSNRLVRDGEGFIVNSYLPRVEAARLLLSLGQVPRIWQSPKPEQCTPDSGLRTRLGQKCFWDGTEADFQKCARALLFELLPTCYLEGFNALCVQAGCLPWPVRPRFIFTSNNFDTDEVFKCWAAQKVESGISYYAGQHGNNYGTYRYMNPSVEELTADKFLTWGWIDGLPQHTPTFLLRAAGRNPWPQRSDGGLLLIEVCLRHRIATWDGYAEFAKYFEDQLAFVSKLESSARARLTVRLYQEYKKHDWSEPERWREFDSLLKLDDGATRIDDLIKESRLVVHSYDSTGILECLALDKPTIAFWQDGLTHLRESAKPHYQRLIDAGIVHLSAEAAAEQVNQIWDDVPGWWSQPARIEARRFFCDRYARVPKNHLQILKAALMTSGPNQNAMAAARRAPGVLTKE